MGHQGRLHGPGRQTFGTTVLAHGIPGRSLVVGLITGTVNTAIVISAALVDGGDVGAIPAALVAQAFVLPTLFGLVSQTLSYRRAAASIGQRLRIETSPAFI